MPPPLGSISLTLDTVWEHNEDAISYGGLIEDESTWLFTLTVSGDKVLGRFFVGEYLYLLHSIAGNSAILFEIDRTRMPHYPHHPSHEVDALHTELQTSTYPLIPCESPSGTPNGNVRILFLYPQELSSTISTLANDIVTLFNQASVNSGMDFANYVSIAGLRQISSNMEGFCRGAVIDAMVQKNSPFESLASWMASDQADIAITILPEDTDAGPGDYCPLAGGLAEGLLRLPYAMSTNAFAMGDLTAIHELGHILGTVHQFNVPGHSNLSDYVGQDGIPECGRGWIDDTNQWFTIMGTYTGHVSYSDPGSCPYDDDDNLGPDQQSCIRIPLWSNPDSTYNDDPVGDEDDHNVAMALNVTMPIAAEWTSFSDPTPNTPSLTTTATCGWMNTVSWNSVTYGETYQVVFSDTQSFSGEALIYSGSGTSTSYMGPGYFKVRSCNGSGCGSWSNTAEAKYLNQC